MKGYGVDSLYSWVLVFPSTVIMLTTIGCFSGSAGIFYVAYMENNKFTEKMASWPSSIHSGMAVLAGPVTAFLTTRFSIRNTVLFGSFLHAVGYCACYFSTSIYCLCIFYGLFNGLGHYIAITLIPAFISRAFHRYRSTAMGIVMTGSTIGGLAYPMVVQSCLNAYGLKGTFLIVGGINLHALVAALTLVEYEEQQTIRASNSTQKAKHEIDKSKQLTCISTESEISCKLHSQANKSQQYCIYTPSKATHQCNFIAEEANATTTQASLRKETSVISILKNGGFHLSNLSQTMSIFLTTLFLLLIVDYGSKKGIQYAESIYLLQAFSGGQTIGRLAIGWFVDKYCVKKTLFMSVSYVFISTLCILLPFVAHFVTLICIMATAGVLLGNVVPMSSVIFSDYIPKDKVVMAMSISRSCVGLTLFLRSVVIGVFCDESGSYNEVFLFLGSLSLFTAIVLLTEYIRDKNAILKTSVVEDE